MLQNKTIAVVIPAYNEEKLILKTLLSIPEYVDKIIVVNDNSKDRTLNEIVKFESDKLLLLNHEINQGVGGAIISGYQKAFDEKFDIAVVVAGDFQMDSSEMENVINPILSGEADYIKGNRLLSPKLVMEMPKARLLGNTIMSLLNKVATGYWHIMDSQCGFTALNLKILPQINLKGVYKRYGFPNDFLVKLNVRNITVKDVIVSPIYGEEKSGFNAFFIIPKISTLLLRGFIYRMFWKYVIYDFHPLVFLYFFGSILILLGSLLGLEVLYLKFIYGAIATYATVTLCALFLIVGLQSTLFAMMFDMLDNASLKSKK
ncbi:MAG: glycosyltransferase family 2 protein [Calditrichaeota bacterium]|nr:MAG: glycosyltransferase family 2 protein [Calditrichota bacterium]